MKNKMLAFGAVSLATLVIAGCGTANTSSSGSSTGGAKNTSNTASGSTSGPIKIQLWESHSSGPVANTEQKLVKKFNASHSKVDISLNITHASAKALAAVTAGHPPVLAEISHYIGKYVSAKALLPLNSFLSTNSKETFWSGVQGNTMWNGKEYRYPADVKVEEFYYNKSLFKKAGIKAPPATWTAMALDLQKLKALGVIPLGFKDSSAHILSAFISNGGSTFAGTSKKKVQFDNSAGKTTFNYFRTLHQKKEMVFGHGNTMRADFGAQKMAIVDGTSAGYQKILAATGGKFKMGAFAFPAGVSGHSGGIIQGLGFVLFNGVSKADQKAAWTFVHWWNEPAQQAYWSMHSGFAPTTPAGAKAIPASWLKSNKGEAVTINILKSKHTVPRANTNAYSEVDSVLDSAFFNAVTGKTSVAAALKKLDTQANQYLSGKSGL
ncbi:extracellular solute-binding protein [Alicyclobacillus sp. SO9]|uniref:extracellular solute-binding protein n=1 Tax=Alicyclobacillus sp. SO9 TaxID=2665646 RepID=UPI0018E83C19|nr:extracellular solute-binding protein [Alicyclobacillus sp. SO9]QQE80042.1 extracellular solute-binding protein [Alicyclobacillus sp. SO9]